MAASVATFRTLAAGQTLYAVGDEPSDFWVVAHGEVICNYCDGSTPATLKVGSYFGEVRVVREHSPTFHIHSFLIFSYVSVCLRR